MTLPLELGNIRDPDIRRQLEIISQQFPVAGTGGGGGAETDPVASPALATHAALTTTAHGGIVASTDARLTDARTPTAHKASHEPGGADALTGLTNASIAAAAGIAKTKLANLDVVNADVNAAAAIAESKLNLATDAVAGTGSRRTLGTTATSAAAGNRGLPTGGTSGQALTKNSATDYDAVWTTVGGASVAPPIVAGRISSTGTITSGTGFSIVKGATGVYTLTFTDASFTLAGISLSGLTNNSPVLYYDPATGQVAQRVSNTAALIDGAWSFVAVGTGSLTTPVGSQTLATQAADVTNATITLANTDLVFTFAASSTYLIDLYLLATSAATTTGYALAFDVSAAVTAVGLTFEHQLATTGTLTGGDSIADATARALSSGVPTASALVPILGKGILVSGTNTGTCRLQFAPEVAASATFKAGSAMRVVKAV